MRAPSKTSASLEFFCSDRSNCRMNTLVEMVFEMPEEISGQKNSTVLCQGRIIRRKDDARYGIDRTGGVDSGLQVPASKLIRERRSSSHLAAIDTPVAPGLSGSPAASYASGASRARQHNFAQDQSLVLHLN